MAGLPGIAVPAGLDPKGLPLGLQLIGGAQGLAAEEGRIDALAGEIVGEAVAEGVGSDSGQQARGAAKPGETEGDVERCASADDTMVPLRCTQNPTMGDRACE